MNENWMTKQDLAAAAESRKRQAERDAWRQARRAAAERDHGWSQYQPQEMKRPPRPLGRSVLVLPKAEFEEQIVGLSLELRQRLEAARLAAGIKDEVLIVGEAP